MKLVFTIGYFPIIDHLILGVAEKKDGANFKNFNLKTQLFQNWDAMTNALLKKEIEGVFLLFPLAIELFRKGAGIKIVLLGHREGQVCVVRNEIKNITDLKGKTVLIPHKYSVHNFLMYRILKSAGLNPLKDVSYKIGFENIKDIPVKLAQNEVQAFVSAEPWGTVACRTGAGKIIATSHEVKPHHICCVMVLRDDVVENYKAACEELIYSLVTAGSFMNGYPRQTAEIGEMFLRLPRKIVLEALTHNKGHILFWDLLPRLEDFESLQEIMVKEMRLWKKPIDLQELICPFFAQNAYRELVLNIRREVKDKGEERTLPASFSDTNRRFKNFFSNAGVVGVRLVKKGEPHPSGILRTAQVVDVSILELLSQGKEFAFSASENLGGIKSIVFFKPECGLEPHRVLLKLSKKDAESVMHAFNFGEDVSIKKWNGGREIFESEFIAGKGINIFQENNDYWCIFGFIEFRFLTLLLHYYFS